MSSVKSNMNLMQFSRQWSQQKCDVATHRYKLQFDVRGVLKKLKSLSVDEKEHGKRGSELIQVVQKVKKALCLFFLLIHIVVGGSHA